MSSQTEMPAHYEDLSAIEATWQALLEAGCQERNHPFKKPVLTTLALDGRPKARIIILRDVDFASHRIRLHTDASAKTAEIDANRNVMLAFYDPGQEIQLQISGRATVHRDDAFADQAWSGAAPSSQRAYLAELDPGSLAVGPVSGLPRHMEGRVPSEEELEPGRENFAAIQVAFDRIEWLFLSQSGNRRAQFVLEGRTWLGTWLAP